MDHHYLPQFFLNQWASGDPRELRYYQPILLPDGTLKYAARRTSPAGTGYVSGLYEVSTPDETHNRVETTFFTPVDTKAASVMTDLLAGAQIVLPGRHHWAQFVLSLMLRTPAAIADLKVRYPEVITQVTPEQEERFRQDLPEMQESLRDFMLRTGEVWMVEYAFSLLSKLTGGKSASRIADMKWKIVDVSSCRSELLLSDWPVSIEGGLGVRHGRLVLAVSPDKFFVAANDHDSIALFELFKERAVSAYNKFVVSRAQECVYSSANIPNWHQDFLKKHYRKAFNDSYLRRLGSL